MAKILALVFGIVFVVVGVLGFIPNPIVGHDARFHTNAVHNLVHLIIGIVLLIGGNSILSYQLSRLNSHSPTQT